MFKNTAIVLAASALAFLCSADIVLSVARPQNMDAYLSVLSNAWPRIYPQLERQLETARVQVPAEYQHMLQILSITGVPSTYNQEWASAFIDVAQRIGPTTIYAKDIDGAMDDPAMQPTNAVTTDPSGNVATITNAPMERPTIVVAINGNAVQRAEKVESSGSSSEGTSSEKSSSDGSLSDSLSSDSSESSSSGAASIRIPATLGVAIVSATLALFI
ncbi:hypothetical protein GGI20_002938 [Coemansia sp. BCRC 34301]|nr:hypothetical protein GGI20_002938 [Coemansia sp. BCRC 34301]